jgi:hypothetical protein
MSNQDEESQQSKPPTYQFAELNYNYYVEQPTANEAPNAVAGSGITSSSANTASASSGGSETTDAGAALNSATLPTVPISSALPTLKLPPLPPLRALPAPNSIGSSKISSVTSRADVSTESSQHVSEQIFGQPSGKVSEQVFGQISAKVSEPGFGKVADPVSRPVSDQIAPNKVEYSLIDDLPEPTFEERVAAMKKASAKEEAPVSIAPSPSAISFPTAEQLPAPVLAQLPAQLPVPAPVPASNSQESAQGWNAYEAPSSVLDVFSPDFNFNRSLLKIFWRIDSDHNNRVCKNELLIALSNEWFTGNERLLAKLMYDIYEDISPETIFCDAGLSINNILNFELFAELAARDAEPVKMSESYATDAPKTSKTAPKKNTKSSQSLRSLFKGR